MRRGVTIGAVVVAMAALVAVRYATFDPEKWAAGVQAEMSPLAPSIGALKAIARGDTMEDTARGVEAMNVDALQERIARYTETTKALRVRFHEGRGDCARYGDAESAPSAEHGEEAADALIEAGLARDLDSVMWESLAWRHEADEPKHHASEPEELFTFFSERANPWDRVGLVFRGGAALAALQKVRVATTHESKLEPAAARRAKEIWARFGSSLTKGAMLASTRMRHVDLASSRLRSIQPGMTRADVRKRLGAGTPTAVDEEKWTSPDAFVLYDDDRVLAITTSDVTQLFDGGESLSSDEPSITRKLGSPLWAADSSEGREVVYERGAARYRLMFHPDLFRVELWQKERLERAQ